MRARERWWLVWATDIVDWLKRVLWERRHTERSGAEWDEIAALSDLSCQMHDLIRQVDQQDDQQDAPERSERAAESGSDDNT